MSLIAIKMRWGGCGFFVLKQKHDLCIRAEPNAWLSVLRSLGRYPTEIKKPKTNKEREERSLAVRLRQNKHQLLESTVTEIERYKEEVVPALDKEILDAVRPCAYV